VTLVTLAIGLLVFVRWLEPRFAFFPSRGESTTPADLGVPFSAATVTTRDGQRLHGWLLRAAAARALVVYFHGNGGNLSIWAPILCEIARRGYDVLAFDYRGYGLSTGRPTEQGLYRDADAVLDYVATVRRDSQPAIYWGRSIGTAVAAYAATARPPSGMILEAGFPHARAIIRSSPLLAFLALFGTYRFPTAAFLDRVETAVLVIHGDRDRVVPLDLGRALFADLKVPKTFLMVPGGDHNDLRPPDEGSYWDSVDRWIATLAGTRTDDAEAGRDGTKR
jgi:fermentation-respiration switch protein FrsA (DUF1100 family)